MLVVKWGGSLAVLLPDHIVNELGLNEGDDIEIRREGSGLSAARSRNPDEILASLEKFRGTLPAHERLSRDEANER